jgi:hypothetical protein
MRFHIRGRALPVVVGAIIVACSDPVAGEGAGCEQLGIVSSSGCAEVFGFVRDSSGAPVGGMLVSNVERHGTGWGITGNSRTTRPDGGFRFRVSCIGPCPPDTTHVWIRASRPAVGAPLDSVAVQLPFAPLGQVPRPVGIQLVVPVE